MAGFKALSESKVSRQPSFTEGDADEAPVASVFQLMVNRMVLQHFSEVAKLQKQLDLLREEYVERLKHLEPSEKSLDKSIEMLGHKVNSTNCRPKWSRFKLQSRLEVDELHPPALTAPLHAIGYRAIGYRCIVCII